MNDKPTTTNMGGTLITGLAIGALIGVLFAPRSGEETRQKFKSVRSQFKKKAGETKDQIQDKVNDGKEKVREIASKITDRTGEAVEDAKRTVKRNTNQNQGA